jgi:outer membrane protein OmpA-like peptidoglycan-associated protein
VKDQTGWSEPINAGPQVNTAFDEMFPFEKKGKLYFASKGHSGLGGLDVYEAEMQGLDIVSVKNAGYPLNSHGDDFSFIVDQDEKSGYIASNRGDFIDRIYAVSIKEVIIELQAKVVATTGDALADVTVKIYDKENKLVDSLLTDATGQFVFKGKPNQAYKIKLDKPGYTGITEDFNTEGKTQGEVIQKEFTLSDDISKTIAFSSTITDKETGNVVPGAKVEIKDLTTGKITELVADKDGKINVDLLRDREYQITTSKGGYDPTVTLINTKIRDKEMQQDIQIRKTAGAPMVRLDNILYEFNKATLSKIGKAELDTLVMFLKENKGVKVDISSHTDARGSDEYNMKLSAARSSSCMTYIVSKGITRDRLEVKNYGETKLLNHCDDGIECSEELHQVNRRTEFVLKFP